MTSFEVEKEAYYFRRLYQREFGFVNVTPEFIQDVVKTCPEPMLEIGAGTGHFAEALRLAGADIIATNPKEAEYRFQVGKHGFVLPYDGLEARKLFPNRKLLIFAWPCYGLNWATEVLKTRPERVIYVGEGHGGCTANDDFHNYLDEHYVESYQFNYAEREGLWDRATLWSLRDE